MVRLLLFLAVVHNVMSTCPKGLEPVKDGECRGGISGSVSTYYDDAAHTAISNCKEIGAQPVIIRNDEQQSYWTNLNSNNHDAWPLGIVCSQNGHWEWADGTTVDYRPSVYTPVFDEQCDDDCSWLIHPGTGEWEIFCGRIQFWSSIYCTSQLHQPIPSGDGCESFEEEEEDGICYQIGNVAESWQDAQVICQSVGANLASIHNSQENSFIRRLAVSKGAVSGVYLGATTSDSGKTFEWIDGSDWDYAPFYPAFPMCGFGDCLAMDTSTTPGQWMNRNCTSKLPVACGRKQTFAEPSCSTDPVKEGGIATSPGYPYSASTPCDYVLIAEKGKNVKLEIITVEANSCCDFLIIYNEEGQVIDNLTGTHESFSWNTGYNYVRASWQPNGGVNVQGMAIGFRSI